MPRPQGFSREERLRKTGDFDRVFRAGRRRRGELLALCYARNGLGHSRLGIALRRGWGTAVARNRAKRLVREAFRTRKGELPKGLDIVVIPHAGRAELGMGAIGDELVRLLGGASEGARR